MNNKIQNDIATRRALLNEIARLENSKPSTVASFNARRAERLQTLTAALEALPVEPEIFVDAALDRMLEAADSASAKNRARDRWC